MTTLGGWLLFVGLLALGAGIWKKYQASKIIKAPLVKSGDAATKGTSVAGAKGAISVEGMAVCEEPLRSPVTGTECLYFDYSLVEAWDEKVYNAETGKDETKSREETLVRREAAARFSIDDGSGAVRIDAGEGGEFDLLQTFKESKGGALGMFKELAKGVMDIAKGGSPTLTFGNVRVVSRLESDFSDKWLFEIYEGDTLVKTYKGAKEVGTKITVKEEVLKTNQKLYVCGRVLDGGGIGAPGWATLLISRQSRDQLLADTVKWTKELLIGGGVTAAVGLLLYKLLLGIVLLILAAVAFALFKKLRPQVETMWARLRPATTSSM